MPATLVEPKSMIFTAPVAVDHDVLGTQVLMQRLLAVEGAQPLGDLLTMSRTRLEIGPGVVDHPLRQRPPLDDTP